MSRFESYAPGLFSWVDLMTPDAEVSKAFYGPLLGWSHSQDRADDGGAYTQFTYQGLRVAGMGEMNAEMKASGMPPVWNSYVSVEDVAAACARCRELGGNVVLPPMEIRTQGSLAGEMAILTDPEGAAISLWRAGEHSGAQLVNDPGGFAWNELTTRDVAAAKAFYAALFGWTFTRAEGDNEYWEIVCNDRVNGGLLPWRAEMGEMPAHWGVYFSVADCDETLKRARELGGALVMGPVDIPPGRFAVLADPLGGVFTVMRLDDPQ